MPPFLSGLTGLRVWMKYDSCQHLTMPPKYFNFDPLSTCLPVWQANQKVRFRFHLFSSFEEAKIKLKGSKDRNFWSCSWRKQSILETSEKNKVPSRKKKHFQNCFVLFSISNCGNVVCLWHQMLSSINYECRQNLVSNTFISIILIWKQISLKTYSTYHILVRNKPK